METNDPLARATEDPIVVIRAFAPHEPSQAAPLTNRVSHRARIEPGEWLIRAKRNHRGAFGAFGAVTVALTSPRKHFT